MASNEVVHVPDLVEIIPAGERAKFREDLATMEKYSRDLEVVLAEAQKLQRLPNWDRSHRIRAGELIAEKKRICKDAESTMDRHKKTVNRFKDEYILRPEKKVANAGEILRGALEPRMGEFDRAEERAAAAERERIAREKQAELDREAERKRQEDEKAAKELRERRVKEIRADLKAGKIGKREAARLLKEAGAMEESLKAQAAADEDEKKRENKMEAATVEVKPNVPSVAGNVRRINYSAECTDPAGFLSEYVRCCVTAPEKAARMRPMIQISNQALSAEARGKIKTRPDDENPAHIYTKEQFEKLFPFVIVREDRSY